MASCLGLCSRALSPYIQSRAHTHTISELPLQPGVKVVDPDFSTTVGMSWTLNPAPQIMSMLQI